MKNKELTHKENKKKMTKFNYLVIIIPIIFFLCIAGIIYYYTMIYNGTKNITKRELIKEGYTCGKNVCILQKEDIKYSYDINKELISVNSSTYDFLMENKSYTYNDTKKGNYCTYTKDDFTKGNKLDKTFTYNSPCDDYIDNVNDILDIYAEIQNIKEK